MSVKCPEQVARIHSSTGLAAKKHAKMFRSDRIVGYEHPEALREDVDLFVDPQTQLADRTGRPMPLVADGEVVKEMLA